MGTESKGYGVARRYDMYRTVGGLLLNYNYDKDNAIRKQPIYKYLEHEYL